jgi:hypothetical protein
VIDKLAAIQMLDVHFPTTDGRTLILSRHIEPNTDQKILVQQLGLTLPPTTATANHRSRPRRSPTRSHNVVETFGPRLLFF